MVKFSIYLNRLIFIMVVTGDPAWYCGHLVGKTVAGCFCFLSVRNECASRHTLFTVPPGVIERLCSVTSLIGYVL